MMILWMVTTTSFEMKAKVFNSYLQDQVKESYGGGLSGMDVGHLLEFSPSPTVCYSVLE